jgi:hypothetical protein
VTIERPLQAHPLRSVLHRRRGEPASASAGGFEFPQKSACRHERAHLPAKQRDGGYGRLAK